MSKTFCPLPWIHIASRPNGDVRLCATANASGDSSNKVAGLVKEGNTPLNLRDHTLEEVWNCEYMRNVRLTMLRGEQPASCLKCFKEEEIGITSKRQCETIEN